jgi:putative addiction module component (TIGR02574 family)
MVRPSVTELRQLDPADRLRLMADLWDTFADDPDQVPVSDESRAELDRRILDADEHPAAESAWSEVLERLKQRG